MEMLHCECVRYVYVGNDRLDRSEQENGLCKNHNFNQTMPPTGENHTMSPTGAKS